MSRPRILAFAAVVLFAVTISISIFGQFIPKASAAIDWPSTFTNTQKYSLYKALSDCMSSSKTSVTDQLIPVDSLVLANHSTGANTSSGLLITNATVPVGLANLPVNSTLARDGNMECNYAADAFADMVGTRAELLTALGYTEVTKPNHVWKLNSAYVTTSTTQGSTSQTQVTVNKQPVIANLAAYAKSKNVLSSPDQYMQYELFFQAFTLGNGVACGAGDFQLVSTAGTSDQRTDKIKFYNIGDAKYDTYLYTLGTASPSASLKVVPGNTTAYTCDSIKTELENRSSTIASSIAAQDTQAAILAATKVYTDGEGATAGLCANASKAPTFGSSGGAGASDYDKCTSAIAACLQPKTVGVQTVSYDTQADTLAACFVKSEYGKNNKLTVEAILPTITSLRPSALAAAGASLTQGDPCSANPQGNDANGNPCSKTSPDPCASIPADTAMPWLACSIFTAVNAMVKAMSGLMENILYTNTEKFFSDNLRSTSNVFRNLALTLIIIAGLIMVIAQATGTDLIDAYTVKKVLPKLGVAVVGIALSWPLLKFAVGLSNDLGGVVGSLFDRIAQAGTTAGGVSTGVDNFVGFIATVSAGGVVTAVIGFWGAILLFLSLLISYITGLIVLLMQKLLLVVLVVAAPLAIAAYVLPGTEKLWKLWKSNFFKVIILYFVIMVIVKIGDVLAAVIIQGGMSGTDAGATTVLAILAKITTLILTFKAPQFAGQILGGVVGMISGAAYKMAGGLKAPIDKQRQQAGAVHREHTYGRRMLQSQASAQRAIKDRASQTNSWLGRRILNTAASAVGGYNLEARMSQRQGAVNKEVNDQIATGMDDAARGLTVNKRRALQEKLNDTVDKDGNRYSAKNGYRVTADGKRQFQTLGGGWVNEASVDEGYKRWGHDNFAQQAALSYEFRKAMTTENVNHLRNDFAGVATEAWGMSDTQANSAWTGAKFENQNQHLNLKGSDWKGNLDSRAYLREAYEKKGSSDISRMSASAITDIGRAYDDAVNKGDTEAIQWAQGIMETFMQRQSGSGAAMLPDAEGKPQLVPSQQPTPGAPTAASSEYYRVAGWGAASVMEEARRVAVHVGVYQPQDPSTNSESVGPAPLNNRQS